MEVWQLILGVIGLILVLAVVIMVWAVLQVWEDTPPQKKFWRKQPYDEEGYDRRGYDRRGYDRDGYDRQGYDRRGYDRDGYNRLGYDARGYDRSGYDGEGYTVQGRDVHGRYNRLHDVADFTTSRRSAEGFLHPGLHPIGVTRHGAQRIQERVPGWEYGDPWDLAMDAYCYGESARQMKPSAAHVVREIERRHESGIVLLYHDYVYIFSSDNQLITVYKNERISE